MRTEALSSIIRDASKAVANMPSAPPQNPHKSGSAEAFPQETHGKNGITRYPGTLLIE